MPGEGDQRNLVLSYRAASVPRPGKQQNEDLIGTLGGLAWLLDGASVPAGMPRCCTRDAAWYVQQLGAALAYALCSTDERDLRAALAGAIETVATEHRRHCSVADRTAGPSATVLITLVRGATLDYLILGDSTLLLETDTGVAHHSDKRLGEVARPLRARLHDLLRAGCGYGAPEYQALHAELVANEQAARNTSGGYWIASDVPRAAYESLTGTCELGASAGAVRRFALLSDGVERGVSVLGVYPSWAKLLHSLVHDSPIACIQAVRDAEAADDQGRRFPRTSGSDDASVLLCEPQGATDSSTVP